jgi:hypothetical protein
LQHILELDLATMALFVPQDGSLCQPKFAAVTHVSRTFKISTSPARAAAKPQASVRQLVSHRFNGWRKNCISTCYMQIVFDSTNRKPGPYSGSPRLPGLGPDRREIRLPITQSAQTRKESYE